MSATHFPSLGMSISLTALTHPNNNQVLFITSTVLILFMNSNWIHTVSPLRLMTWNDYKTAVETRRPLAIKPQGSNQVRTSQSVSFCDKSISSLRGDHVWLTITRCPNVDIAISGGTAGQDRTGQGATLPPAPPLPTALIIHTHLFNQEFFALEEEWLPIGSALAATTPPLVLSSHCQVVDTSPRLIY